MAGYEETDVIDGFEIDSDGIAPEAIYKGGGNVVNKEGSYHFNILGVTIERDEGKVPSVKLDCQVLAGDHSDQVNRMVYHRIRMAKGEWKDGKLSGLEKLDERGVKKVVRWAVALGLVNESEIGGKLRPNWKLAEGRQFIGKVAMNEFDERKDGEKTGNKRQSYEIAWGDNVWPVNHEDVAEVPKDPEALALITGGMGIGGAGIDVSDI